jgi:1-acyl-sn-glycerol-3-phosphate acyltransferase
MLGGLFIDRNNPRKALRTISEGSKKIEKGNGMLIFPEGTRSKIGELLPFHAGSFKLATEAGAVIVPAALRGSRDVFEKTGYITAADITVQYAEPIDTKSLPAIDRRQKLSENVHEIIRGMLAQAGN